jgi:hypothetical protein
VGVAAVALRVAAVEPVEFWPGRQVWSLALAVSPLHLAGRGVSTLLRLPQVGSALLALFLRLAEDGLEQTAVAQRRLALMVGRVVQAAGHRVGPHRGRRLVVLALLGRGTQAVIKQVGAAIFPAVVGAEQPPQAQPQGPQETAETAGRAFPRLLQVQPLHMRVVAAAVFSRPATEALGAQEAAATELEVGRLLQELTVLAVAVVVRALTHRSILAATAVTASSSSVTR